MAGSVKAFPIRSCTFAEITIKDIDIVLASLLFFDPTGGNGSTIYSLVRYSVIVYLAFKNLKSAKDAPLPTALLLVFSFLMMYSTWINTQNLTWSFSGFMFGFAIVTALLTFVDACRNKSSYGVLRRVFRVFALVLFVNDVFMVILPYNYSDSSTVYLVGNKFIVSYAHCLLAGLMLVLYKEKVALSRGVVALCAVMSYLSGSSTGAMMMAIMFILTFVPSGLRAVVSSPLFIAGSVAALNVLIWGSANFFHLPAFQDFMVNVLHKSADMTGRERLYNATFGFVEMKPIFGWGYLTDIYRITFGYGNAQNGLFHLVTQCGIIGTVIYFAGLMASLKADLALSRKYFGLYAFLFCMVLGSSVEINLSFQFAFGIALLCGALRADELLEE